MYVLHPMHVHACVRRLFRGYSHAILLYMQLFIPPFIARLWPKVIPYFSLDNDSNLYKFALIFLVGILDFFSD